MKKVLATVALSLIVTFVFISCKSKEKKVIDQLNNLTVQIEKKSDKWNSEDWQNAFKKVEEIHNEMSECDFSNEQLQELGEVEGRLTSLILKNGLPALGSELGSMIDGSGSFVDGFQDGIKGGAKESLEEIESSLNSALDRLKELDSDD